MDQLKEHFKKNGWLHHAYVIEGEKGAVVQQLVEFFEKDLGIPLANNPDYWFREFATFGIDEARDVRERQSRVSASGQARNLFVISAERVTVEAQNALLKTLEEPTAGPHIFIIVPSSAEMLSTVRSRAVFLRSRGLSSKKESDAFLLSPYHEREKFLKSFPEDRERGRAGALLAGLYERIKEKFKESGNAQVYHDTLRAIEKCREHLGGRAPSVKMLLEYLAVVLPREK